MTFNYLDDILRKNLLRRFMPDRAKIHGSSGMRAASSLTNSQGSTPSSPQAAGGDVAA